MGKSVHVLQAGDEVQKLVRMAAMAVMDAQIRDGAGISAEARAAEIVRERRPDLAVDGEMQADTAVVAEIVEQRYPFSRVSEANILVCPSLEAANIGYKLLERIGGAEVVGPVLLGMGKSVHVLQAGDEVQKIVRMAAMAVMDAQIRDGAGISAEARAAALS
jgi:malate dehydrogenase (oxaloacetate-decarboxylating)(NADP+)